MSPPVELTVVLMMQDRAHAETLLDELADSYDIIEQEVEEV